ncbi:uncharacterized protein ACNLHF_003938 [Anomaloglossus baeobatrachus]|uniref:uncharacterized protein LOC142293525 n=1 Tax=Anomaloglossus baeobatrachus TaxID=238106 RepID=UPI003F4F3F75
MDLQAKLTSWQSKATNIFSRSSTYTTTNPSLSSKELTKKYRNLMFKQTKIWWTKTSMENYWDQKIVPRGLRIQIYPTFDLEDDVLIKRWMEAANTCSLEFIKIIIDKNSATLQKLEEEIKNLQESIKAEMDEDAFKEFSVLMTRDSEKWEKNISASKASKYQRDISDFEKNNIFHWQTRKNKEGTKRGSITSVSSISDNETASLISEIPKKRKMQGKQPMNKRQYNIFDREVGMNLRDRPKTSLQ